MSSRVCSLFASLLMAFALAGCPDGGNPADTPDAAAGADGGEPDATPGIDGSIDASSDAAPPEEDAGALDAGPGVRDLGPDLARPDAAVARAFIEDEFCTPLVTAACAAFASCACDADSVPPSGTCVTEGVLNCIDQIYPSVASGALVYDAETLPAIVDKMADGAGACRDLQSALWDLIEASFYVPAELGEPCPSGDDFDYRRCAQGNGRCIDGYCGGLSGVGAECGDGCMAGLVCGREWTCLAPSDIGTGCSRDEDCFVGAVCFDGNCAAAVGVGDSCTDAPCGRGLRCLDGLCSSSPVSCESPSDCGDSEDCVGEYASECSFRAGFGERCYNEGDCDDDLLCVYPPGARDGTCGYPPGLGESCENTYLCERGLVCSYEDQLCYAPPSVGEACIWGSVWGERESGRRYAGCAAGYACSGDYCAPLAGVGEDCSESGACAEGAFCRYDFEGGTGAWCENIRGEGEQCNGDEYCTSDLFCDYSGDTPTCVRKFGLGEICDGWGCADDLYCSWESGGTFGTCSRLPSLGESCDGSCADGFACRSYLREAKCTSYLCGGDSGGGGPGPGPGPVPL